MPSPNCGEQGEAMRARDARMGEANETSERATERGQAMGTEARQRGEAKNARKRDPASGNGAGREEEKQNASDSRNGLGARETREVRREKRK